MTSPWLRRAQLLTAAVALSPAGCGGAKGVEPETQQVDAPHAAPDAASAPEPAEPPPSEEAPAAEPTKPAVVPAKDPNAMREVRYVVAPEGLKIEVAGVRFLASAEAKQVAQGWGVKVTVKAEVTDGKTHVLMSPKSGPLAFAAAVFKKGSTEAERLPDSREGDGELELAPGGPITFSRDFPAKGGRVLAIGETLDMEVALWGLGETAADRRPVKQFFHVKMKVEKGKPRAKVEPPAAAAQ